MDIIIDSTWIAAQYGSTNINGGYRVIDNFIKQLGTFKHHNFYLTHTTHKYSYTVNLRKYILDTKMPDNIKVEATSFKFLDTYKGSALYSKVNRYIPISSLIPFISISRIFNSNIYYSALDNIPFIIKRTKLKKYFTALDLIPLIKPELSNLFYDYTRNLYDKLTSDVFVLAISHNTKKDLLNYRPDLDTDKIKVIHLAADQKIFYNEKSLDFINKIKMKYNINTPKYFLSINSHAAYKNSKFVVDKFNEWLIINNINDTSLVLIGKTMDEHYKKQYIISGDIADKFIFLDKVEDSDLAAIYSGAQGFIYLSKYEGFGLPVLESMQCGTPVICADNSSLPEVAGDAAIMIDAEDYNSYWHYLSRIRNDDNFRNEMAVKGIKRANEFSWERYAREVIEAFESSNNYKG